MLGLATPLAAVLLILFLLPTFLVHRHWLDTLPGRAKEVATSITDEHARSEFRLVERHAIHSHETGLLENLVYLVACLYFAFHGAARLSLDALIRSL